MRYPLAALLAVLFAPLSQAGSLDIALSNNTVAANYAQSQVAGGLGMNLGVLHNTDRGNTAHAGVEVRQDISSQVRTGLGARLVFIDPEISRVSGSALALGGSVRVALPGLDKVGLGAHLYVAPRVTSFQDAELYVDSAIRADYEVMRNGTVFVGYRDVSVDFKDNRDNYRFDNHVHFGLELKF
jgi:hypothetical protein